MEHYETHFTLPTMHNNGSTKATQIYTQRTDGCKTPPPPRSRTYHRDPTFFQISLSSQLIFQHPPRSNLCRRNNFTLPKLHKLPITLPCSPPLRRRYPDLTEYPVSSPSFHSQLSYFSKVKLTPWTFWDSRLTKLFSHSKRFILQPNFHSQTLLFQSPSSATAEALETRIENNLRKTFFSAPLPTQLSSHNITPFPLPTFQTTSS